MLSSAHLDSTLADFVGMKAWGSSSEWYGRHGSVSGPAQPWTDATILWYDVRSSRGSVLLDDGRTVAISRHQLPSGLSDNELLGVARRRVRMADFRFGDAPGEVDSVVGQAGKGVGLAPGFGEPHPSAGNYRLAPTIGQPWRSPSSEEQASVSPAEGTSGALTLDEASDAGVGESPPPGPGLVAPGGSPAGRGASCHATFRDGTIKAARAPTEAQLHGVLSTADPQTAKEHLAEWAFGALDSVRHEIPSGFGSFGRLADRIAELDSGLVIRFAVDPKEQLAQVLAATNPQRQNVEQGSKWASGWGSWGSGAGWEANRQHPSWGKATYQRDVDQGTAPRRQRRTHHRPRRRGGSSAPALQSHRGAAAAHGDGNFSGGAAASEWAAHSGGCGAGAG